MFVVNPAFACTSPLGEEGEVGEAINSILVKLSKVQS